MNDVEAIVDGLVAGSQGASSLAVREARLRLERWTLLDNRQERTDQVELLEEASQILNELAITFREG